MENLRIVVQDRSGKRTGHVPELRVISRGVLAEALFEPGEGPALPLGSEAPVEFSGKPLSKPRTVTARVRARSDDENGSLVTFELGEEARALLLPGVSRRGAVRVRPSASEPIRVELFGPKSARVEALCRDLSTVGLAVLLSKEAECQLSELSTVTAEILLPGQDKALALEARICQRKLAGPKRLYGLEFARDPGSSDADWSSMEQTRIHEYVMDRQRAMLQAARQDRGRREAG